MTIGKKPPLPPGWTITDLQTVAQINPTMRKSQYPDTLEVSFVPMADVEAGTGVMNVATTRPFGEIKKGFTPFQEGDVLFAKITPCMENGKMAVVPALMNELGLGSTEFHVLRPHPGIHARYLYHFISSQTFRRNAEWKMTGAVGQRRVPTAYLQEHPLPLPPSSEQKRIVDKLEETLSGLNKGLDSFYTARKQLEIYRQAVLKHAFDGRFTGRSPSDAPSGWALSPLGELVSLVTSGSRGWAKYYSPTGDLFIRAQNLKYDRLSLDDVAYVQLPKGSTAEGTRTRVRRGDVLITITGANVTKTGFVERDIGSAYISQHVALVRPTDVISPEFLYWFLIAEVGGRRQLNDAAYGAGKPGLNLDNIRSVAVPVPDPAVQTEVVTTIKRLLSLEEKLDCELSQGVERVNALRESILRYAFAGRLVSQNEADEPAAVLLERLTTQAAASVRPLQKKKKRKDAA